MPIGAGSLKVTCTTGQQAYTYTSAAFGALNGATAWTIALALASAYLAASVATVAGRRRWRKAMKRLTEAQK